MDINDMQIFSEGHLPIVSGVYDQLKIGKKIDEVVSWDKEKCKLSPGEAVKALILNILSGYDPLYMISEFYKDKDVEKLVGESINYTEINEFAIGRNLDKIYDSDAKKVYSHVVLTALKLENIDVKAIHWDTTSKSFSGDYERVIPEVQDDKKYPINITFGHSKDYRRDLKQMKFGVGTTKDKLPLFCDVLSGNEDDKKWNGNVIKRIEEELSSVDLSNILHVADSALVTTDNLKEINDETYKFISRLPGTFSLEAKLIKKAIRTPEKWEDLSTLGKNKKRASKYRIQSFKDVIGEKKYRFVVCHSSNLAEQNMKTLERNIEKEKSETKKAFDKAISRDGYFCEADAQKAILKFEDKLKLKYHTLKYTMQENEQIKKRSGVKGRRKKDEIPETEKVYIFQYELIEDKDKINQRKEEIGMFVLITNELNEENLSNKELLMEYKDQNSVESTFKILKSPSYVDAIFLNKPERIEAFGYVMVLAVLLMNLIERRICEKLKLESEEINLLGRRKTFSPTATALFKVFEKVKVVAIPLGAGIQRIIPGGLDKNQKRILKLCGLGEEIYLEIFSKNKDV
ncbi:transposase [Clostridium beijerinckii]|uniref:IS1634 family transposase n=1 Tax=Clostridium beijerinckii TaxID=1520 RepID=UPI001494FC77|nr:IS1634 family transposase [Clostridium beijerinckii]NOW82810.1 transposase [Clostridium beijerinckii]NOW83519.1 transposase [Clostridium beijerinckii]NOW83578.1 transposase [Clostridium beijerinckii]NOW83858.1 transposase [Clostridium beijerinckii]NOW84075.1 transposase [Clostridium beijerinckii]